MSVLLTSLSVGGIIGIALAMFVVGAIVGSVVCSWHLKKQINQNPLINEEQIRALYRQTGRKLSEVEVMRIMKSIKQKD